MKEILDAKLHNGRNSEHYQLHASLLGVITPDFATRHSLTTVREQYELLFKQEDAAFLMNQAYADTRLIEEKDKNRDQLFGTLKRSVESYENWPVETKRGASAGLAFAFKPYRGASSRPIAENTALLSNLLQELELTANKAYLTELGLSELVALLKTANEECTAIYAARSDAKLVRAASDNLKTIRPQVDNAFALLAKSINSLYLVNELVAKDSAIQTSLSLVIEAVNALLLEYSAALSRRGVGKKLIVKPGTDLPAKPENERPDEV